MAQMPVKKKPRMPWWVWALVAVLVVVLLWWLLSLGDEDEVAQSGAQTFAVAQMETASPAAPDGIRFG